MARADAESPNMGLTTWAGAVPRRVDVMVAKNYLAPEESHEMAAERANRAYDAFEVRRRMFISPVERHFEALNQLEKVKPRRR